MKREGRQHGYVRSYSVLSRPKSRVVNPIDDPPAAGLFVKVPSKPSNHSKFTGKCGRPRCHGCRDHPVCKSRVKSKGTHKLNSQDVVRNQRLLAWRVVDEGQPGLGFLGDRSERGILGLLDDGAGMDYSDDQEEEEEKNVSEFVAEGEKHRGEQSNSCEARDEEDGTELGFHDLGFVLDLMDDVEDWCLIGDL